MVPCDCPFQLKPACLHYGNILKGTVHDTADEFEQLTREEETASQRMRDRRVVEMRRQLAVVRQITDLCRIHDNGSDSTGNVSVRGRSTQKTTSSQLIICNVCQPIGSILIID